ncbi:hypothetical protein OQA88_8666 [Cercophora sp. LCS_1]
MDDPEFICFKCKVDFGLRSALETHLMSCTEAFEPRQSTPWAFVPPPSSLEPSGGRPNRDAPVRRQPPRAAKTQRRASASSIPLTPTPPTFRSTPLWKQPTTNWQPSSSSAPNASKGSSRNQRGKDARRPSTSSAPTGSSDAKAKCTKCDLAFPSAHALADHFIESDEHPYSVQAPKNSWGSPGNGWGPPRKEVKCFCGAKLGDKGLEKHRKCFPKSTGAPHGTQKKDVQGRKGKGAAAAGKKDDVDVIAELMGLVDLD